MSRAYSHEFTETVQPITSRDKKTVLNFYKYFANCEPTNVLGFRRKLKWNECKVYLLGFEKTKMDTSMLRGNYAKVIRPTNPFTFFKKNCSLLYFENTVGLYCMLFSLT